MAFAGCAQGSPATIVIVTFVPLQGKPVVGLGGDEGGCVGVGVALEGCTDILIHLLPLGLFTFDEELNEPEEAVDFPAFPQDSDDDEASTDGTLPHPHTVSSLQAVHPLSIDGSLHEESSIRQVACSLPMALPMFSKPKQQQQDPLGPLVSTSPVMWVD